MSRDPIRGSSPEDLDALFSTTSSTDDDPGWSLGVMYLGLAAGAVLTAVLLLLLVCSPAIVHAVYAWGF